MIRNFVVFLLLLSSVSLQAQLERKDSTTCDNIKKESQQKSFIRAVKKFINLSDYDTLFVSPSRYNYAFLTTHFSNFEYCSITSDSPHPQKLSFTRDPHNKIGAYIGWRWVFIGWSVDIDDVYRNTNQKNRGTSFDLSLYSSKFGLDLFYRSTNNDYEIHGLNGFPENISTKCWNHFDGLKVDIRGLSVYYIFNNRRFSYPAAFSQYTNQRRSTGSFMAGFSITKHKLDFDYNRLPDIVQETMNPNLKMKNIKYTNASLNFGYAYNWVFARNCVACLALTPAISYKNSTNDSEMISEPKWYGKFNLDFLFRAGVVYNDSKYFVGSSFIGKNYNYHRNNFSMDNGFGTLQIYAGFNFNVRKEYRKNK